MKLDDSKLYSFNILPDKKLKITAKSFNITIPYTALEFTSESFTFYIRDVAYRFVKSQTQDDLWQYIPVSSIMSVFHKYISLCVRVSVIHNNEYTFINPIDSCHIGLLPLCLMPSEINGDITDISRGTMSIHGEGLTIKLKDFKIVKVMEV